MDIYVLFTNIREYLYYIGYTLYLWTYIYIHK